jgi:hypothetical protein
MTKDEIEALSDSQLKSLIATLNQNGSFMHEIGWAKDELDKRGVDYRDCLEPRRIG